MFDTMQTVGEQLPPSYSIAPTQRVRIIIERMPREEPRARNPKRRRSDD